MAVLPTTETFFNIFYETNSSASEKKVSLPALLCIVNANTM